MNDRQIDKLLIAISQGDDTAFETLYAKTKRGVFSFLYSFYKNYENTEDAMQSVYLRVKQNADKYRSGTNGRAWLLQIAKNYALNELGRNKRVEYTDVLPDVPQNPSLGGVNDIMQRVLDDTEYRIVVLHVLWGYKHREIAEILDCPTGTVTSKYKRSVEKLKIALKEEEL